MKPSLRPLALAASLLLVLAHPAFAQDAASVTSFGKRAPTIEELKKAFASPPKSSALQTMGSAQPVKKTIDMELLFPFASATISPKVKSQLSPLGEFLQGAQLAPGEFLIEGHTDASGAPDANVQLAARRAMAVKSFLVSEYKLDPRMIATSGLGSSQLKDAAQPASEVNRRVEFSMLVKE